MRRVPRRHRNSRGFTVIELLVAAAIMTVLLGMVLSIVSTMMENWNRAADRARLRAQTQSALERIASELEAGLISETHPGSWAFTRIAGATDLETKWTVAAVVPFANSEWRLVWYGIPANAPSHPFLSEAVPGLFRQELSAEDTWNDYLGGSNGEPESLADFTDAPTVDDILLPGVVSLEITPYVEDASSGKWAPLTGLSSPVSFPFTMQNGTVVSAPAALDVSLRVMTPEGVAELERQQSGAADAQSGFDRRAWIEAHSEVFVRRLVLANRR